MNRKILPSPSNFSPGTVTDTSVTLNSTPGTDPGGAVVGYTVSVSSDQGQNWNVYTPSGGDLAYTATGVTDRNAKRTGRDIFTII